MRAIDLLHRLLLRLYPLEFRRRFGAEIADGFVERIERRRGALARGRFVAAALIDLLLAIAAEWWRLLRRPGKARSQWRGGHLDALGQDLRSALKSVRQQPGFAAAVALTLGLGVGANAAIFRVVDAVLLRPLPIADPDRVVAIFTADDNERTLYGLDGGLSYSTFRSLQRATKTLDALAGFIDVEVGAQDGAGAEQFTVGAVSGEYFSVLGLAPAAGRWITPADDVKGAARTVAVLSDGFFARRFGRDPAALGQTIRLGGTPFTVVGIAPPSFRGTRLASQPELWVPLTTITSLRAGGIWIGPLGDRMLADHPLGWVSAIGRLAAGATIERAETELSELTRALRPATDAAPPTERTMQPIALRPITEAATLGDRTSLVRFVALLVAIVGATLCIAVLNVATLVLVRAASRGRQLALRAAIGASRFRLCQSIFVDHLVLAAIGAGAALLVGAAVIRLLARFTLPSDIVLAEVPLAFGARSVGATMALATMAALTIAIATARRTTRPDARALLRTHAAALAPAPGGWLVAGQVALTIVLLVGAALFVRSVQAGLRTDLGFRPDGLAAISIDLFRYGYNATRARTFYDELYARVSARPGVEGAAFATHVPLSVSGTLKFDAPAGIRGADNPIDSGLNRVSSDYFDVMGIPLVAGRGFTAQDGRGAPPVSILNVAAARALFGDRPPLGQDVRIFGNRASTVIGIVANSKQVTVGDRDVPMIYQHFPQETATGGVSIIVRSGAADRMLDELPAIVSTIDPALATYDRRLITDQVQAALTTQRFGSTLLGLFATMALVLAAVGVYGVVAYTVSLRQPEIGLRIALGAAPRDVLEVVLRRSGRAIVVGVAIGLVVAVGASRALERFL
ncbi:MAG TPA: ADOP family duplicated permease, partial [Vicinamibacterales bacterium]|nr:ADOP family duplicated permease [Vicinamibacterales bacterium]